MNCDKVYICNCGHDNDCREIMTEMFGALTIKDGGVVDPQNFKDACGYFDKFITGFCADDKRSLK